MIVRVSRYVQNITGIPISQFVTVMTHKRSFGEPFLLSILLFNLSSPSPSPSLDLRVSYLLTLPGLEVTCVATYLPTDLHLALASSYIPRGGTAPWHFYLRAAAATSTLYTLQTTLLHHLPSQISDIFHLCCYISTIIIDYLSSREIYSKYGTFLAVKLWEKIRKVNVALIRSVTLTVQRRFYYVHHYVLI